MKISQGDFKRLARACLALRKSVFLGFGSVTAVFTGKVMRATDGKVGIEIPFETPEVFAVPVENFFEPFDRPAEEDFVCTISENRVELVQGRFRGVVPCVSLEDAPAWPVVPSANWVEVKDTRLWEAMNNVVFAASTKVSALNGVGVYRESVVAGDGMRATYAPVGGIGSLEGFFPQAVLTCVEKAFVLPLSPDAVVIEETRVWLRFAEGILVWALLPEAPLVQRIYEAVTTLVQLAGASPWVGWDRIEAQEAATRVAYFAGVSMSFEAMENGVRFAAESVRGSAEESVSAETHHTFAIKMNPQILGDAIGRASTCALTPDRQAVVFRAPGYDYVVMTMVY